MPRLSILGSSASLALVMACSPALDWRELRPAGAGVAALLPCKPASHARRLDLAGAKVTMTLHACTADGVTWALAHADVGDPARVAAALAGLRDAALANLGPARVQTDVAPAMLVSGATPNRQAGRVVIDGRLPDGSVVQEHQLLFVRGTTVFQATAIGPRLDAPALEAFFGGLRVLPS